MHCLQALRSLTNSTHAASLAAALCYRTVSGASASWTTAAACEVVSLRDFSQPLHQHQHQRRLYAGSPPPQHIRDFAIIGELYRRKTNGTRIP